MNQVFRTVRRAIGVCLSLSLLALCWHQYVQRNKDCTKIPLSQNPHIRDVVEPIKIIDGIIFADGGSHCITFEDARGVKRSACLLNDTDFKVRHLSFGDTSTTVPIRGIEEKAFLGLLQRWVRQDPEVQELIEKIQRYRRSGRKTPMFTGEIPAAIHAKGIAIGVLESLTARN